MWIGHLCSRGIVPKKLIHSNWACLLLGCWHTLWSTEGIWIRLLHPKVSITSDWVVHSLISLSLWYYIQLNETVFLYFYLQETLPGRLQLWWLGSLLYFPHFYLWLIYTHPFLSQTFDFKQFFSPQCYGHLPCLLGSWPGFSILPVILQSCLLLNVVARAICISLVLSITVQIPAHTSSLHALDPMQTKYPHSCFSPAVRPLPCNIHSRATMEILGG